MPALQLAVLGPLTASRDGQPVPLGGARQRTVLAVLLSARGARVPAARLAAEVWADDADPGARSTLAAYVSRLRRLLPDAELVGSSAGAYALTLPPGSRDDDVVADLLARARSARADARPDDASVLLGRALERWRGEPYAGLQTPALQRERERLEDLRRAVTEELAATRIEAGRPGEAVADLRSLLASGPPRPETVRLLATALSASGRQPEALALLGSAARDLAPADREPLLALQGELLRPAGEPGTDPPAATDPRATTEPPEAPRADVGGVRRPGAPPLPLSTFVGREDDLAGVSALVRASRLVTVVGSGGAGKTRLALELVRDEPADDVAWISLAPLRDAALVRAAFDEAVAVPLGGDRRAGPTLVVVDNAEHVRDATARCVSAHLAADPRARILATSREPLGLAGERVVELAPLPVDADDGDGPAVRLFLDRVDEVVHGWRPSEDDLAAVRRICRRLDGLPLALELAAAQCQAIGPGEVAEALVDRFALLVSTGATPVAHHRTLEAAIAWSYDALPPADQDAFRALAAFVGGFDLDAARWLVGPDATRVVGDLAGRSLVTVDRTRRPRRYALLESLREFAVARWSPRERDDLVERHAAWVADLAGQAAPELLQGDAAGWLRRLDGELPNVRTAVLSDLACGRVERAAATTAALSWFWYRRRHTAVGLELLQATVAVAPPGHHRIHLLGALCHLQSLDGQQQAALRTAQVAAEEAAEDGASTLLARTQSSLGWMLALAGDHAGAAEHAARGRRHAAEAGEGLTMADSALAASLVAYLAGDLEGAAAQLEETRDLALRARHAWCATEASWLLAKTRLRLGLPGRAAREAAAVSLRARTQENAVLTLAGALAVAVSAVRLGRVDQGVRLLGAVQAQVAGRLERVDALDGPASAAAVVAAADGGGALADGVTLDDLLREGAGWDEERLLDEVRDTAASLPADAPPEDVAARG